MLESVLLQLNDDPSGEQAIQLGVELARQFQARVRGLTLLDTRRLESVLANCEAAVYASAELDRLNRCERDQQTVRLRFCRSCLSAGVDFDLRCARDNAKQFLAQESRFHDLILAACPVPGEPKAASSNTGLTAAELVALLTGGVQPLLVVRGACSDIRRVLLVGDESPASSRAVRSFLQQGLFPDAECRLLGVGRSKDRAREILSEMLPCCRARRSGLETGYLAGPARKVVVPYAEKWRADLVVLGVNRGSRVFSHFSGETARNILLKSPLSLYATN